MCWLPFNNYYAKHVLKLVHYNYLLELSCKVMYSFLIQAVQHLIIAFLPTNSTKRKLRQLGFAFWSSSFLEFRLMVAEVNRVAHGICLYLHAC